MKLSDTDLAAAEHALHVSMATTTLQNWPDGLLLQLLQLDQLTKLNEHMVGLKKAHLGAIDKMADLLEVIEKHLPTAPHVPDEEEAAEAEWQAHMNRELITDPIEVQSVSFAGILAKKLPDITPDVVVSSAFVEALRAEGLDGYSQQVSHVLSSAGFRIWGPVKIRNLYERVWVSKGFFEVLLEAENSGKLIREYLSMIDAKNTEKTPENVSYPLGKWPLGASARDTGNGTQESLRKEAYPEQSNVTVIDPDHYA